MTELLGALGNLVSETKEYGRNILRLSEFAESRELTPEQVTVLRTNEGELVALGLKLGADLDGGIRLQASGVVGIARYVEGSKQLIVQVEPKIAEADVFRMLDAVYGLSPLSSRSVDIPVEKGTPTTLFLDFFLSQLRSFLQRSAFRGYRFAEVVEPGRIRGRPLVGQYLSGSASRGRAYEMPCRYVEFSPDVFEHQVLAYGLHVASGLIDLLSDPFREPLHARARELARLLPGVTLRRIDVRDIDAHRYSRLTENFRAIHKIARVLIGGYRTTLAPGSRVPFTSFGVNMGELFEQYVIALLRRAFPTNLVYQKPRLSHSVVPFGKTIELDGLLVGKLERAVVECKYKDISSQARDDGDEWIGDKIRSADLYQTIAYATHRAVTATSALIVYPAWSAAAPAVEWGDPTRDFGWVPGGKLPIPCYLVGINLSADCAALTSALASSVSRVVDLSTTSATSSSSSVKAS